MEINVPHLEIFYDAQCPICVGAKERVKARDPRHKVLFTDLNENADLICMFYGMDADKIWTKVHGIDDVGTIFSGFDLVLKSAEVLGYTKSARFFSLPVVKQVSTLCFTILSIIRKVI